jgi:GNAT superfamily N-acetyltransferase
LQFLDVTKDVLRKNYVYAREHDIKHKHRVSIIDKTTNKLCAAYRLERGDAYIAFSEEVKDDPGLYKMKKQNILVEDRAKAEFPQYFQDMTKMARTNGGTVLREYRGQGAAKLGIDVYEAYAADVLGCTSITSIVVAPEIMHIYQKIGYKVLSTAYYDEEGEGFLMSLDELKKKTEYFEKFRDARPCVKFMLKELKKDDPSRTIKFH